MFSIMPEYVPLFLQNYLPVESNGDLTFYENEKGMFGIADLSILGSNKLIIPTEYEEVRVFDYDLCMRFAAKKGGKWGLIDLKNEILVEFEHKKFSDLEID